MGKRYRASQNLKDGCNFFGTKDLNLGVFSRNALSYRGDIREPAQFRPLV